MVTFNINTQNTGLATDDQAREVARILSEAGYNVAFTRAWGSVNIAFNGEYPWSEREWADALIAADKAYPLTMNEQDKTVMNFTEMSRIEILESFGYVVIERTPYHVALCKADPEAFMVICDNHDEAVKEAYAFLYDEVDPDLHALPPPL